MFEVNQLSDNFVITKITRLLQTQSLKEKALKLLIAFGFIQRLVKFVMLSISQSKSLKRLCVTLKS